MRLWAGLWRDIVLNRLVASPFVPVALRWMLLRVYGLPIEKCRVSPGVWIGSTRLSVGRGTFINYGCMFNTSGPIEIGRNCDLAMGVLVVTSSHAIGGPEHRAGAASVAPVRVGDGTWIGARAIVLPGVTIGEGVVVAAGSVVASDCESNSLYAGVPARMIRRLAE